MGSSEFLQALLSTIDESYKIRFSIKTRLLLRFFKIFFPRYIKKAAKSRLKLKKDIRKEVIKISPDTLIELGSGFSKYYIDLMKKGKIKEIIQVDKERVINVKDSNYKFIRGDITKEEIWGKINKIKTRRGLIIAEGLLSYLTDEEFNFFIERIKDLTKKNYTLITHEPLRPISFSRKIISLFIGKTYRRFDSVEELKRYYKTLELNIKIINSTKWQAIYKVY